MFRFKSDSTGLCAALGQPIPAELRIAKTSRVRTSNTHLELNDCAKEMTASRNVIPNQDGLLKHKQSSIAIIQVSCSTC